VFSYISYWAELLSRENQAQLQQGAGVLMMVRFISSMIPSEHVKEGYWARKKSSIRRAIA
jgi:hypothetical protein